MPVGGRVDFVAAHLTNTRHTATLVILTTVEVGQAPTHTVTNPNEASPHFERLTLPLSADNVFRELEDVAFSALQKIVDSDPAGAGRNHPHAQWTTSDGQKNVFPNVFKGLGTQGSVSIVRKPDHEIVREFRAPAMQMPVATGIQPVSRGTRRTSPTSSAARSASST